MVFLINQGAMKYAWNYRNASIGVAFADGHCVKLLLPVDASEDNLKELTTWLCTGVEYTFNGGKYEKVAE